MKLYATCSKCHENITFSANVNDRTDLEEKHGQEMQLSCDNCHQTEKFHLNKVKAKVNMLPILIAVFVAFLLIGIGLFALKGYFILSTLPIIIIFIAWGMQQQAVKRFNSYKVRRPR